MNNRELMAELMGSIAIVFHKQPTGIAPEIIAAFMCADAMLGCSCIEVK